MSTTMKVSGVGTQDAASLEWKFQLIGGLGDGDGGTDAQPQYRCRPSPAEVVGMCKGGGIQVHQSRMPNGYNARFKIS